MSGNRRDGQFSNFYVLLNNISVILDKGEVIDCEVSLQWSTMQAPDCYENFWNEPPRDKTTNVDVRPAKTQISLGICPVWSESSLYT